MVDINGDLAHLTRSIVASKGQYVQMQRIDNINLFGNELSVTVRGKRNQRFSSKELDIKIGILSLTSTSGKPYFFQLIFNSKLNKIWLQFELDMSSDFGFKLNSK